MRRIILALLILFFLLLLHLKAGNAYASFTITATDPQITDPVDPSKFVIDETTHTVTIKFDNLIPGGEYYVCPTTDIAGCLTTIAFAQSSIPLTTVHADQYDALSFPVCGDGEKKVRSTNCTQNDAWFHGGHHYAVSLININTRHVVETAAFDVHYYFPEVTIASLTSANWLKPEPGKSINVLITQDKFRSGDKTRLENMYRLLLESKDRNFKFKTNWDCDHDSDTITHLGLPAIPLSIPENPGDLDSGSYILSIIGCGAANENVTYYQADIEVASTNGSIGELVKDPLFSDTPSEDSSNDPPPPPPPCVRGLDKNGQETSNPGEIVKCLVVSTALGDINTEPAGFVKSIFGLILGLSGGIALLLIIISGYRLMAARGNPEALQAARDQLISAIIGLIFIIFSLVILEIIGVDILKIPGFTR